MAETVIPIFSISKNPTFHMHQLKYIREIRDKAKDQLHAYYYSIANNFNF